MKDNQKRKCRIWLLEEMAALGEFELTEIKFENLILPYTPIPPNTDRIQNDFLEYMQNDTESEWYKELKRNLKKNLRPINGMSTADIAELFIPGPFEFTSKLPHRIYTINVANFEALVKISKNQDMPLAEYAAYQQFRARHDSWYKFKRGFYNKPFLREIDTDFSNFIRPSIYNNPESFMNWTPILEDHYNSVKNAMGFDPSDIVLHIEIDDKYYTVIANTKQAIKP